LADISFMRVVLAAVLAMGCAFAGILASGTASEIGWPIALVLACVGYGLLQLLERMGVPVCPSCSHSQGFSGALVAATALHAFVDGWGMMAISSSSTQNISRAILAALLLHKIPEGLALGAILRMSARKPQRAIALAVLAESPTLAGGMVGLWAAQASWIDYPLALAGGAYLFLGINAIRAWVRPTHEHDHPQRTGIEKLPQ
jgi:hypothetical protein